MQSDYQQRRRQMHPRQSQTRTERQAGPTKRGGGPPQQRVRQPRQSQTRRQATGSARVLSNCVSAFAIGAPLAAAADASCVAASETPTIMSIAIRIVLINFSRVCLKIDRQRITNDANGGNAAPYTSIAASNHASYSGAGKHKPHLRPPSNPAPRWRCRPEADWSLRSHDL